MFIWYILYHVGLGYHDDLQTRAVFMEVLTRILQQVWNTALPCYCHT